jgi:hypothetical protein
VKAIPREEPARDIFAPVLSHPETAPQSGLHPDVAAFLCDLSQVHNGLNTIEVLYLGGTLAYNLQQGLVDEKMRLEVEYLKGEVGRILAHLKEIENGAPGRKDG